MQTVKFSQLVESSESYANVGTIFPLDVYLCDFRQVILFLRFIFPSLCLLRFPAEVKVQ